jgi:hypothetical protein
VALAITCSGFDPVARGLKRSLRALLETTSAKMGG